MAGNPDAQRRTGHEPIPAGAEAGCMVNDPDERNSLAAFLIEAPMPVLRVSGDGSLLYANPASSHLLQDWRCSVGQGMPEDIRKMVADCLAGGEPIEKDVTSGGLVFSLLFVPLPDKGYVNLYGHDVTERRRAEAALVLSEQRLRLAVEGAELGIWQADLREHIVLQDARMAELFGYPPELSQVDSREWEARVHPDDRGQVMAEFERMARGESVHDAQFRVLRPDGTVRWAAASARAQRDSAGKPWRVFGVAADITERKLAEQAVRESEEERRRALEALRRQEEHLRIAQEAAGAGMWNWNVATNEVTWSPEYYDVYGLDYSVPASYDNWLGSIHEQDREAADQAMHAALRTCKDTRIEFRIVHPRRGVRWLASIGRTICDERGRPVRMTGLTLDITDRRKYMEQLEALNATLEQRVADRTAVAEERALQLRMLAGQLTQAEQRERRRVAHILHEHFQQLLAGVKFHMGVIRRHLMAREPLASIQQVNEALNEAINTSRTLTVELSPPILYDAGLAAGLNWLGRWMQERHELKVEVEADPAVDPVSEDIRVALFLATRELLRNVVRHAKVDRARVSMGFDDEGRVRITVTDEGAGFDPAANGRTLSGFGLFAIRERLEMLGGRMTVESRPGQGTRVTIQGPLPAGRPGTEASGLPVG